MTGDEEGFSLVELLIAIAIVGIAFAAILGALGTGVLTSGLHRDQTETHVYARQLAEAAEGLAFVACASSYTLPPSATAPPAGFAEVTKAEVTGYWLSATNAFSTTCPSAALDVLQLVSVTVTPPDDRSATVTLELTKRKP